METLHFVSLFVSFLFILYKTLYKNKSPNKNLPLSPPSLPILGHFHLLKGKPLTPGLLGISARYNGPILSLRLGCHRVLVVSAPSAVEECFTKNDVVFANRPYFSTWNVMEYNYTGLGSAPYGHHWRNLRRLTAVEVFSSARMLATSGIRAEEVRFLVKEVFLLNQEQPRKLDVNTFFYALSFNIMTRLFAGYRHFGEDVLDPIKGRGRIDGAKAVFYPASAVDLVDFFPLLRVFSPLGGKKKMQLNLLRKREDFVRGMINENTKNSESSSFRTDVGTGRTLIDTLLSLQESEPELYTNELIYGLVSVLLVGGTHSSALSLTSTVSHLMSHPDILKKARDEIDANVPRTRLLDDSHLSKLSYLLCIINESLRIGPVGSIIPLHESSEDCKIGGYDIPRGTMLFVNAFALHKNPEVWVDPEEFKPERFQGREETEKEGASFMPFGLGRRKCPGWSLALRLMALALGTLIQCFEWEGCDKSNGSTVEVIFTPREELVGALSKL